MRRSRQRQKELQEAEAKRVAYETQNLGLLPGVGSVSQRMEASRAELGQIEFATDSGTQRARGVEWPVGRNTSDVEHASLGGGGAPSALAQAQGELASMRARGFTDSHPDVIASEEPDCGIACVRRWRWIVGGGGYKTPNPAYSSLQSMRAEREASVTALASAQERVAIGHGAAGRQANRRTRRCCRISADQPRL